MIECIFSGNTRIFTFFYEHIYVIYYDINIGHLPPPEIKL